MINLNPFYQKHPESKNYGPIVMEEGLAALPEVIKAFLIRHGIAAFSNGFLLTPTKKWSKWIKSKLPETIQPVAFLRTAFGGVFYWEKGFIRYYNPVDESVTDLEDENNFQLVLNFFLCDRNILENHYLYPLFVKAMESYGEIQPDEYYKFITPVTNGGLLTVENLAISELEI